MRPRLLHLGEVEVDLDRMRRERHARLQTELAAAGVDAAVLLHGPHVGYATGLEPSGADAGAIALNRPVAIVVTGASQPHLFAGPSAVGPVAAPFVRSKSFVAPAHAPRNRFSSERVCPSRRVSMP